jgi:toxin ParE1/3/4
VIPLQWTEQAADDLTGIRDFIARDSPVYAQLIASRLYLSVGYLREFPDMGRVVPERDQSELRELIRLRYRIVYRRSDELIEILTIFHSSRPFPETLG